jgi:hypothetical protein
MPPAPKLTESELIAMARRRGLSLDRERAAVLRPQLESLLGRLARFGDLLPRDAAPPPLGMLADSEEPADPRSGTAP